MLEWAPQGRGAASVTLHSLNPGDKALHPTEGRSGAAPYAWALEPGQIADRLGWPKALSRFGRLARRKAVRVQTESQSRFIAG